MVVPDGNENLFSEAGDLSHYDAIGVGPGLGTHPDTRKAFKALLQHYRKPMVIDADALNMLSMNKEWMQFIPENSVLTPHPKEFERIAGETENSYIRLLKQAELSQKLKCTVVLKGANTSVTSADGRIAFNSTGNPGMATAGSGDVLTGIILSLLSQGYSSWLAATIGVYLHGLAGDLAAADSCFESIIASDIIKHIGIAFNELRKQ
jgi:NAD(P)H-hydrate epimerase